MHSLWTALFGILAAVWAVQAFRIARGVFSIPRLADIPPAAEGACPHVSVLFSARNEAEKLSGALETLLAQDYPHYEVIAVDDRSTDDTPQILNAFARSNALLKVAQVTELPAGWLGKPHGLQQAYEHSRGEWLVFTDADVHFAPDLLRRAITLAQQLRLDHLTLITELALEGFWEKTAAAYLGLAFVLGTQPWLASRPRSRFYVGVGAFQLLRRTAYEAIGTHRRLAMEVIDDMKLGRLVKLGGFRSGVAFSGPMLRVRWYAGLRNMIRGVTKNMFAACDYSLVKTLTVLCGVFGISILPLLGLVFASGWPQILAGVAVLAPILLQALMLAPTPLSTLYALTQPLGAAIFCFMLARSTVLTLWRGGVEWRGTFYPLKELKRSLV